MDKRGTFGECLLQNQYAGGGACCNETNMTAYDQNPWTLPAQLFDSIERAEKEIQSPTPENTAAVIPRLGRNGDIPTIEDFAGCGRGLIVCTDGPGEPLAFRNSWPDVVEVVFPHGPFGAAHARNVGLGVAASRLAEWAWLIDSDCSSPGTIGVDGVSCLSELFAAWRPGCAAIQVSVIFDGGGSPGEHGEIAALLESLELFKPPQDSLGPQAIVQPMCSCISRLSYQSVALI